MKIFKKVCLQRLFHGSTLIAILITAITFASVAPHFEKVHLNALFHGTLVKTNGTALLPTSTARHTHTPI
jgi:hypothetical protein